MNRSVRDITTAIASGDPEAFSLFYKRWFDVALMEARRASQRDEQFCLDIVQETMLRVIRAMKPIDDESGLRRWLCVVVQSCCYDQFRREKRRVRRERAVTDGKTHTVNDDADERLAWLNVQLCSLAPDEAHLLTLRFRLGWTLQRIGRSLGLKPGAVDGRITRSLATLRQRAEEEFHE